MTRWSGYRMNRSRRRHKDKSIGLMWPICTFRFIVMLSKVIPEKIISYISKIIIKKVEIRMRRLFYCLQIWTATFSSVHHLIWIECLKLCVIIPGEKTVMQMALGSTLHRFKAYLEPCKWKICPRNPEVWRHGFTLGKWSDFTFLLENWNWDFEAVSGIGSFCL